jgi:hypothetical protein
MLNQESPNQDEILLKEVHLARKRYHANEGTLEEYALALKKFSDFFLNRNLPRERALTARSGE